LSSIRIGVPPMRRKLRTRVAFSSRFAGLGWNLQSLGRPWLAWQRRKEPLLE